MRITCSNHAKTEYPKGGVPFAPSIIYIGACVCPQNVPQKKEEMSENLTYHIYLIFGFQILWNL